MSFLLDNNINDSEFLYRGVVSVNWDFENNRASSAAFKDSKGTSVNRDGGRTDPEVVEHMVRTKPFKAIIKVTAKDVRDIGAIVIYKPEIPENIYHSEIHDSSARLQLRGSKPAKLRDRSIEVFRK